MPDEPRVLIRREVRAWAIAGAVVVPLITALVAWRAPVYLPAVAWLCIVALGPTLMVVGPWRIAVDAEGITIGGVLRRRRRWRDVAQLTAAISLGERYVMIAPRSAWRSRARVRYPEWGPALLSALREHAPAGTYRLTAADEQMLAGRGKHEPVRRARARRTTAPAAAYRESARVGAFVSLDRPLPAEKRLRGGAWLRGTLALVLVATAFAVEGQARGAAVVASIAVAWVAMRAWAAVRAHAKVRTRVREWVGERPRVDRRGMLVAESGRRRFRQLPADLEDPWMGLHFHLEDLEPGGIARSSAPLLGPDLGLPATMRAPTSRELARVVGGRGQRTVPAFVVIDHGPDGALLHRFDVRGRAIGDTFHEDASAARAQATRELELEPWRELDPRGDPWALAKMVDAEPEDVSRSTGTPP